jgi:hypothetical protein
MPKSIYDRGLLKPGEVAKLQRVFDALCATRGALPDSTEARDIALDILALHHAGMEDETALLDALSFRRERPKAG